MIPTPFHPRLWLTAGAFALAASLRAAPPGAEEPVRYTGDLHPEKTHYDGRIPHAAGVHNIQVFRANRTAPSNGILPGHTYNHQPYLAHWRGRHYLQFLSAEVQEHEPPTRTSLTLSDDGYTWSAPRVVFPEYVLPEINHDGVHVPAGMFAVMHQRMGFYTAPDGRLLTLGFYGYCATPQHSPNAGNGLGRVVREIMADGSLGPIYFIRYNRHAGWNESNTAYPFYRTSPDAGFVAACDALLADKIHTLQWWEEDRATDGFYALIPDQVEGATEFHARMVTAAGAGKAFAWFTRPDGVVTGLWKNQYSALSADRGRTWTPIVRNPTLRTTGAKTWGQRTADGRYAIVHNHSATGINRFPASVLAGTDGRDFDTLLCFHGEVTPRRYRGQYKNYGPQYFRGITEGNGMPPGAFLWVTYSMNKEDIWITRAALPLTGAAAGPVRDDFEPDDALDRWNLHLPLWAPTRVESEPNTANRLLALHDRDPADHAQALRIFPTTRRATVSFRVQVRAAPANAMLEVEVQSQRHHRPMRLRLGEKWLSFDHGRRTDEQVRLTPQRWHVVELELDCERQSYALRVDGTLVRAAIPFTERTESVERVVFRTGPWRGLVPAHLVHDGGERPSGLDTEDLAGADTPADAALYWIDDLVVH